MNVYLIPAEDSTYVSYVSDAAPSTDAIFLVEEGEYPTVAYHQRHDLNMCSIVMEEEVKDRDALIDYLNFLGRCRNRILSLWGYDADESTSSELHELFSQCIERKADMFYEAMMEMCEGVEENDGDYDNVDTTTIYAVSDLEKDPDVPF